MASHRAKLWNLFSSAVTMHIERYTLPQYGDFPNDALTSYDSDIIINMLNKYITRLKNENMRGEREKLRDCLKIAHFSSELWYKLHNESDEEQLRELALTSHHQEMRDTKEKQQQREEKYNNNIREDGEREILTIKIGNDNSQIEIHIPDTTIENMIKKLTNSIISIVKGVKRNG